MSSQLPVNIGNSVFSLCPENNTRVKCFTVESVDRKLTFHANRCNKYSEVPVTLKAKFRKLHISRLIKVIYERVT